MLEALESAQTLEEMLLTEEQLMGLGSDARVEIWDGRLVEMSPVGGLHHIIAGNIYYALQEAVQTAKTGLVFMDGLIYLMHRQGKGIKGAFVPDVSFIHKTNIPKDWNLERPFPGVPTVAVEVLSPDDDFENVLSKVNQYLEHGTDEVWLVFPRQREIYQYRRNLPGHVQVLKEQDQLDVSAYFPAVSLALGKIFSLPELG